jgi:hypothetical protein
MDLCAASPQQPPSADHFAPGWRAFAFPCARDPEKRCASAPPYRRSAPADGELSALRLRLELAQAQERTSRVQLEIEQARERQQQERHKAALVSLPLCWTKHPGPWKVPCTQRWDDLDESFTQGSHGVKSPLSLIPPVQGNRQDR